MVAEVKRKRGFIVSIVGLLLVILGVLWITVIFPAIDKVPLDYDRAYYFVGNITDRDPDDPLQFRFYPVEQELMQKANGTKDGALLIHEVRKVYDTSTEPRTDISDEPYDYGDESTLAIDRRTMEFVQAVDERGRWGYWGPPRPIGKDDSYDLWNPGAGQPQTANYVRSEDFRGLSVLVFEIDESDLEIGNVTYMGMELPLSYSITITQWVEPSSGTVVYNESVATTTVMGNLVQKTELRYAERTIDDLMDIGRSAHTMLLWFRTIVPWILIGLGAVMVLLDVLVLGRKRRTQE